MGGLRGGPELILAMPSSAHSHGVLVALAEIWHEGRWSRSKLRVARPRRFERPTFAFGELRPRPTSLKLRQNMPQVMPKNEEFLRGRPNIMRTLMKSTPQRCA